MQMRDALDRARKPLITDGTSDPNGLHRPGYRVRVGDDRRAVRDARAARDRDLVNAWKNLPADADDNGAGKPRGDSRSVHDDRQQALDERDAWLRDAWRQGK